MRGKLRDKRTATRRDSFRRDIEERRRPENSKRNTTRSWLNQQLEEDELDLELEDIEELNIPEKK